MKLPVIYTLTNDHSIVGVNFLTTLISKFFTGLNDFVKLRSFSIRAEDIKIKESRLSNKFLTPSWS
jgi:hypothetical protein